jgi:hypothetical protein
LYCPAYGAELELADSGIVDVVLCQYWAVVRDDRPIYLEFAPRASGAEEKAIEGARGRSSGCVAHEMDLIIQGNRSELH